MPRKINLRPRVGALALNRLHFAFTKLVVKHIHA
jgi:hypothetical protein